MVLSKVTKVGGTEVVSLYMPRLRDHINSVSDSSLADVKKLVKEVGGATNASCRFLSASSTTACRHSCNFQEQYGVQICFTDTSPTSLLMKLDAGICQLRYIKSLVATTHMYRCNTELMQLVVTSFAFIDVQSLIHL